MKPEALIVRTYKRTHSFIKNYYFSSSIGLSLTIGPCHACPLSPCDFYKHIVNATISKIKPRTNQKIRKNCSLNLRFCLLDPRFIFRAPPIFLFRDAWPFPTHRNKDFFTRKSQSESHSKSRFKLLPNLLPTQEHIWVEF